MELLIPLQTKDPRPLYEQIYQYIKQEIRNGNLPSGKKLPSSRELAASLHVSRSTTQLAYEQLVSEGYLEARPRSGYFAAVLDGLLPSLAENMGKEPGGESGPAAGRTEEHAAGTEDGPVSENTADLSKNRKGSENTKGSRNTEDLLPAYRIDFSPRGIDLEGFPFSTWRKISRAVLRDEENEIFLKGDPQGDLPLREAIRAYLHAARGVNCDASQILIGAGNEYLLMLLSGLLGRDAGIAMENPTYRQACRVFGDMGHTVVPIGMDECGMRVKELLRCGDLVRAAYVMPSHQFPTGIVMPVKRRQELLSWAESRKERYLIEDDYDSEFRFRGKPIPALQGLDRAGRVIYMGTFSKAIAPAIRVGYMVLPPELYERYQKQARFYSSTVSRVDQQILERFLSGGYFERHLNRMREIYKGKHDVLLQALRPFEDTFEISGEFAGLHLLLRDKRGRSEEELTDRAARAGVRVYGLSRFMIGEEQESGRTAGDAVRAGEAGIADAEETPEAANRSAFVRKSPAPGTVLLGYASLHEQELREGAELLRKAWGIRCAAEIE